MGLVYICIFSDVFCLLSNSHFSTASALNSLYIEPQLLLDILVSIRYVLAQFYYRFNGLKEPSLGSGLMSIAEPRLMR